MEAHLTLIIRLNATHCPDREVATVSMSVAAAADQSCFMLRRPTALANRVQLFECMVQRHSNDIKHLHV